MSSDSELSLEVCRGQCRGPTTYADDSDNCGSCGHACASTAVCNHGECSPGVTTLVPPAPGCGKIHLAAAGGTVYWTESGAGAVKSVPTTGGAPTTVAAHEASPERVRVSGQTLLWSAGTNAIRKVTLPGGRPADLVPATVSGSIPDFVVSEDGQLVYYLLGPSVMRLPITGGTPVEVARRSGGTPQQLAVSGNKLAYDCDVVTLMDGVVSTCGMSDPFAPLPLDAVNCSSSGCQRLGWTGEGLFFFRDGVALLQLHADREHVLLPRQYVPERRPCLGDRWRRGQPLSRLQAHRRHRARHRKSFLRHGPSIRPSHPPRAQSGGRGLAGSR